MPPLHVRTMLALALGICAVALYTAAQHPLLHLARACHSGIYEPFDENMFSASLAEDTEAKPVRLKVTFCNRKASQLLLQQSILPRMAAGAGPSLTGGYTYISQIQVSVTGMARDADGVATPGRGLTDNATSKQGLSFRITERRPACRFLEPDLWLPDDHSIYRQGWGPK